MPPRQRFDHGEHRPSTVLELLFDLATVIAIATAAAGLHHGLVEGQIVHGLLSFIMALFMIWWSWMNYTWFASAYDDRSPFFRAMTFIVIFGALTLAAGIPAVYAAKPIITCLLGFVIMRCALAALWVWAPYENEAQRFTSRGYACGILLMQLYWIAAVLLTPVTASYYVWIFIGGVTGELLVPVIAEARGEATSWHREHIVERYGLVTIIVLGECFLSVVGFMRTTGSQMIPTNFAMLNALSCAVITFCMYGYYFHWGTHLKVTNLKRAIKWGYGHFFVFAAAAAVGAGFAVLRETLSGESHLSLQAAELSVSIPVAMFIIATWWVRDRFDFGEKRCVVPLVVATLVAPAPFLVEQSHFVVASLLLAVVLVHTKGALVEK
ncbi:MAG: low temperature requirement protein A [Fimbriimonadaceae bacterium]|nr:low temperature requirement protein A [Fimbriimonadaceae bacterium]